MFHLIHITAILLCTWLLDGMRRENCEILVWWEFKKLQHKGKTFSSFQNCRKINFPNDPVCPLFVKCSLRNRGKVYKKQRAVIKVFQKIAIDVLLRWPFFPNICVNWLQLSIEAGVRYIAWCPLLHAISIWTLLESPFWGSPWSQKVGICTLHLCKTCSGIPPWNNPDKHIWSHSLYIQYQFIIPTNLKIYGSMSDLDFALQPNICML